MPEETLLSESRARGLHRLLLVVLGLMALTLLIGVVLLAGGYPQFGAVVVVVAVVVGACAGLSLRNLPDRGRPARTWCIATAIVLILGSVPLVTVWIGLLTVVAGVGLLFAVLAPERDPR